MWEKCGRNVGETIEERREKNEVRDSMETRKKSERIIGEMRRK